MPKGEAQPIVIDAGSAMTRVGFGGEDAPRVVFPSLVGHGGAAGLGQEGAFVGEEARAKRPPLELSYPIEHGLVRDWADVEILWRHTFKKALRVPPDKHGVLLSESPFKPKADRDTIAKILFETFKVPKLYLASQAVLALYASGRTTGLVVSCGHTVTNVVPVFEGQVLSHAVKRLDIAGREVTDCLAKLLAKTTSRKFTTVAEKEIVRDIKEKLGFVALDYDQALGKAAGAHEQNYELPDGLVITISSERFQCAEMLFQPSLHGAKGDGIHKLVSQSLAKCDADIRKDLYGNIVLAGGSTMFQGLADRMQKEVTALAPKGVAVKIIAPPERKYTTWIGGSILSSLSTFQDKWVTKAQYSAKPSIVHLKWI